MLVLWYIQFQLTNNKLVWSLIIVDMIIIIKDRCWVNGHCGHLSIHISEGPFCN